MERVTVYSPQSPLRRPLAFFGAMAHDMSVARELGWRLFVRDVSAQYRQSILGYIWVFVPPIVASLPFIYLRREGIMGGGSTSIPYGAFAMIGTIIWQSFVDALNAPLKAVISAKPMLTRINLPREAILLSAVMQVLFSLSVRLILMAGVLVLFQLTPAWTAPYALLGIFSLIAFGLMVGLLLTPLGVLYSDVQQFMPVMTTFLMLLTPVVYPPPDRGVGAALAAWNPLAPLVTVTRDWLIMGPSAYVVQAGLITVGSVTFLLLGWIAFRVAMPHLVARIGS